MIKFIAAAIVIVAATIGGVLFSFQSAGEAAAPAETPAALLGRLDYVKTDIISVPVLRDNEIAGYFLGRFVYTVEPKEVAKLSVPATTLIIDEVYSYLFSSPEIDFTRVKSLDLDAFRANVRDAINKRIGAEIVHDVLIEQVDFLSKAEIRDNSLRRRMGRSGGGEAVAAEEPAKESSGH
jgi:hypothetical protein